MIFLLIWFSCLSSGTVMLQCGYWTLAWQGPTDCFQSIKLISLCGSWVLLDIIFFVQKKMTQSLLTWEEWDMSVCLGGKSIRINYCLAGKIMCHLEGKSCMNQTFACSFCSGKSQFSYIWVQLSFFLLKTKNVFLTGKIVWKTIHKYKRWTGYCSSREIRKHFTP